MPRLENWGIIQAVNNPYIAPERRMGAKGEIYDDEKNRFQDGTSISTSRLIEIDFDEGYIQTKNTKYELGKVNDEYKKYCQDNNIDLGRFN